MVFSMKTFREPPMDLLAWWKGCYKSLSIKRDNCKELSQPENWNLLNIEFMTGGDWDMLAAEIEAFYSNDNEPSADVDTDPGADYDSDGSSYFSATGSNMSE
jgi:hypothetical protein